ncbi:hypothetical protein Lalb_Chr01g0011561 [Lupinus albus]|uniref:Uncharacterized protein n=1 Tax=Lupinus albus TaxID=3870 RepID=A0A6A4R5G9_LUPAL|nr:hypothetical protein Lalb_Chr01g0011561 [Lupinus albus]
MAFPIYQQLFIGLFCIALVLAAGTCSRYGRFNDKAYFVCGFFNNFVGQ